MGKLIVVKDEVAEKLDELSDLAKYWKKHRDAGRTPSGIRAGMLASIEEINLLLKLMSDGSL